MSECSCGCGQIIKGGTRRRQFVDANHKARAWYAKTRRNSYQRDWWEQRRELEQETAYFADSPCLSCFFVLACRQQCARVNAISVADETDWDGRLLRLPCFLE